MMPGKIYLIQNDKSLQALTQQRYPNEDDFQALPEQYPDLLAGDQMNTAAPRRQNGDDIPRCRHECSRP